MKPRIEMDDIIHVPLTAAQSLRLQRLIADANAANAMRDNVLSALVEGVTDKPLSGYSVQLKENELVLTASRPMPSPSFDSNGIQSPADSMSQ
jgi:hypothetical protein